MHWHHVVCVVLTHTHPWVLIYNCYCLSFPQMTFLTVFMLLVNARTQCTYVWMHVVRDLWSCYELP